MLVFFRKRKEYREKGMAAMREEKTSAAFDCFRNSWNEIYSWKMTPGK